MKQEIVVKVQMRCDKCRTKAMELAASADGVNSVSLGGEERNELVVVGDGIDVVSIASILRKKVGPTNIMKVGESNENGKKENGNKGEKERERSNKEPERGSEEKEGKKGKKGSEEKEESKGEKGKDAEHKHEYHQYQYPYQYQQQQQQQQYQYQYQQQYYQYPGYTSYPQVIVYDIDSPSYPATNCCIM